MRAPRTAIVALGVLLAGAAVAQDPGTDAQREDGKTLYDKYCSQCHGANGDGNGHATQRVKPAPRDFTTGKYKFRTTPNGMLPTDADLTRVIRKGLPYTSMPGFPIFTDGEVQNIVYYIKSFSEDFQDPEKYADPIDIPQPPAITDESVARGAEVYKAQGCGACHGELGRGDGLSAPTLTDDWGDHIRAADMSQRWTFRGGPTRQDMFRTFSTGLNGTPMPSYFEALAVEDRWDLVNYMVSLGDGDEPAYSNLLIVSHLEDEFDIEKGAELFADAPVSRFPLVGQIVEPGREFYPSATSIEVQAVYNRKEIAFLLRWHDMRAEQAGTNGPHLAVPTWDEELELTGGSADDEEDGDDFWGGEVVEEDEGDFWGDEVVEEGAGDFWGEDAGDSGGGTADSEFSDAVALQFPASLPTGVRKPYFILGDTQNSVDLWFVDLARDTVMQQFTGRGRISIEPSTADEFEVRASYDRGEWTAIFKRELRSTSNVTFESDKYIPVAFSVWDGFNRERGNKRALSQWFHLYMEPIEQVSYVGPMVKAAFGALLVELLIIFWIRRRYAADRAPSKPDRGGAVPAGGLAQ